MATFIDKNPASGVETWVDDHDDDQWRINHRQNVAPFLDYAQALRNDGATDRGIRNDFWHFATIPNVVILKLKQEDGVDVFNRNHYPRLFQLLNTKYRYLKTTDKRHTVRH